MIPQPSAPVSRHLGLDLGGTNVKWAVLGRGLDEWRVEARDRESSTLELGSRSATEQLVRLALRAVSAWPPLGSIGIGLPGSRHDPEAGDTGRLPNLPGEWRPADVAAAIGEATGLTVSTCNDARAFGIAELALGAGRGASTMAGFTLGTGVGGVVAVGGRVLMGHDGTAGELGHQTIDPDGPLCGCGNRGCLEAFARADRIAEACGTPTVEAAVELVLAGDRRAVEGWASVGRALGIGIANVIAVLAPDVVVVGGGVAAAGDLLLDPIRAEVARRVRMTDLGRVSVVAAELGTWAGAIGAAVHGAQRAAEEAGTRA